MKPLVYLDIAHNASGAIVIKEERFREILDEVYEAGHKDGFEKGKNSNYPVPYLNSNRNWNQKPILTTTPTVMYNKKNLDKTIGKTTSSSPNGILVINADSSNDEFVINNTLIKDGEI